MSSTSLPGSDRLNAVIMPVLRTLVQNLWNVRVEGLENIPASKPAILTPNHLSFSDSVFIPAVLPRRMWAIGKGEYMDDWKTKHVFPAMGMIPVDRSGGDAAQVALDMAARVLDHQQLFMMYPEGTRSRSGHLHKGRTGPARLASRCNAPIIPVGHQGTIEVQPPDYPMMKPFKDVVVRFGKPMWVHDHGDPTDPRTIRQFTDDLMFAISELSGQSYVHSYANQPDLATTAPGSTTSPTTPSAPLRRSIDTPGPPVQVPTPPVSIGRPPARRPAKISAS